jgi:hypothetical protein
MAPLAVVMFVLCSAVPVAASIAARPRHAFWLLPLSAVPWLAVDFTKGLGPHFSSFGVMPPALTVLLPFLAIIIDRWKALRVNRAFWVYSALGFCVLGFLAWGVASGELWLNHDGEYCRESGFSSQDCPLDPLLAGNVYLTAFGFIVLFIGPVPALLYFGCLGYRRWFRSTATQFREHP